MGGEYDPSQKLLIEQFIGNQLKSTLGVGVAGSDSILLVNSEGTVIVLPISSSDHVIEHQGAGGPQSLFAIGSRNFIGEERKNDVPARREQAR